MPCVREAECYYCGEYIYNEDKLIDFIYDFEGMELCAICLVDAKKDYGAIKVQTGCFDSEFFIKHFAKHLTSEFYAKYMATFVFLDGMEYYRIDLKRNNKVIKQHWFIDLPWFLDEQYPFKKVNLYLTPTVKLLADCEEYDWVENEYEKEIQYMFYKTEKEIAEDSDRQIKGWVFCLFVATPHKIELYFCIKSESI